MKIFKSGKDFNAISEDENRHTNPIKFLDANGKLLYSQQPEFDETNYAARNNKLGKAFYNSGKLVNEPMDFSIKNRISLEDLHQILKSIYFPKSVPSRKRFDLYPEDYRLVYQSMSQYPPESRFPSYDTTEFYDTYCKYFLFGSDRGVKPDAGLRIFNKVGDAYGFLLDVAYIVDFEHKVGFMLSAIIYCNRDEVLNDDKYDFDSIGYPFFRNLGKTIYDYELKRTREHAPDLTSLLFDYSKQP